MIWLIFYWQRHRKLYIFGGQRSKEPITEFISYDVDTQSVAVVKTENAKNDKTGVPQSGFTQRATIDCERDEIYVLSVSSYFLALNEIRGCHYGWYNPSHSHCRAWAKRRIVATWMWTPSGYFHWKQISGRASTKATIPMSNAIWNYRIPARSPVHDTHIN